MTQKDELIGVSMNIPSKASERPFVLRVFCSSPDDCAFFIRGECLERNIFGFGCVHGKTRKSTGPTRRAKAYSKFIAEAKSAVEAGPRMPGYPRKHLAVMGGYVYIPYNFASMCEKVPFLAHGGAFRLEKPFIPLDKFTAEVVVELSNFRPFALMGGEIKEYQA